MGCLRRYSSRALPTAAALVLSIAFGAARAESVTIDDGNGEECRAAPDVPTAVEAELTLAPPALFRDVAPQKLVIHVDVQPKSHDASPHPFALGPATHLSLKYLWLAVHGDGQAGFSTFLGISTASLGGFRLRF